MNSHLNLLRYFATFLLLVASIGASAQSRKIYVQPDLSVGLTSGYHYANGLNLDPGEKNGFFRLECRGGYYLNNNVSVFTGIGFSTYRYRMLIDGQRIESGHPDMIREQEQALLEIPLGIRYTTYHGGRQICKTRYYGGGGFRLAFLNDARYDYRTVGGGPSGFRTEPSDFNSFHLRAFLEAGIDVPLDYNAAFLIGLNISHGISRNMSGIGGLTGSNYGVLAYGLNLGFRFGI